MKTSEGKEVMLQNRNDLQIMDTIIVYNEFHQIIPDISESPYFFHWWMPFPHQPIRYNKDCKLVYRLHGPGSRDAYELNYEIWSDSYYGQTKCAEKELVKYAKKIIEHDKNAIILIHSDHGIDHLSIKHDHPEKKDLPDMSFENLLGVFAAFRMPERCNKFLDAENSPVNAFRIIFACLDNKQPVLLPHKTFVIDNDNTYVEGILEKNVLDKYIIKDFNDE